MVRRGQAPAETPEGMKTPHRIELCEPKRNFRKRSKVMVKPKTENFEMKLQRKNAPRSKPLKTNNGCPQIDDKKKTAPKISRSPNHLLTEYYSTSIKCEEPAPAPLPPADKTVKVEQSPNHKLTEYFPVRRSVRKTSKCVLAEKMRNLEKAIREEREDGLEVCIFPGKGRGVLTKRPFTRGEFVVEYAGELIGVAEAREREAKYAMDPDAGCYMYYFRHGDQQYCIDATEETDRIGRLVNHSRGGNLVTKALWVDGPRLVLLAAHDIAAGVELTYDYGDRSRESLRHHPWLAL